jgi:MFS family permease
MASFCKAGIDPIYARITGFEVISADSAGCLLCGRLADKWGRTRVISGSLFLSGICAAGIGLLFSSPLLLTVVALSWGLAVVADGAQFSAAMT